MKDSVANVGADWIAVPMPAAEGYPEYKPGVNLNVYGYIYAKQGITNPEAIVVMLNHLVTDTQPHGCLMETVSFIKNITSWQQIRRSARQEPISDAVPDGGEY